MTPRWLAAGAASVLAASGVLIYMAGGRRGSPPVPAGDGSGAGYVGGEACAECHAEEIAAWSGSDHDLAMQEASEGAVLGDFAGARFEYAGITSTFFRREGRFFVNTDGPNGKLQDYEIKYTFGLDPLQQYLIELPGGRLQALSLAWDTHPKAAGGQRWFHLYPRERIRHDDELHWTKPAQNWNYMCAECHATGLERNFDPSTRAYATRWERLDVGCEACHGPGSRHIEWAEAGGGGEDSAPRKGFLVDLGGESSTIEIETCARCHSRRAPISDGYRHEHRLMDDYLPALLEEGLYYADGQILEEVYEYGSFLQSRMYATGVRCSHCHEPHSLTLRAPGNGVCTTCHSAGARTVPPGVDASGLVKKEYDAPGHHFHTPGRPGSRCVDCHAPARNYMVVDPRRDHSFRIPRPDLSVRLGTPDACNQCHVKEGARWASEAVARWYGPKRRQEAHYGEALAAGRAGKPGAVEGLVRLAGQGSVPAVVRATALSLLERYPGRPALEALGRGLTDPDPLVRLAAVGGHALLPPEQRVPALLPGLADPVRAVRIETTRLLAPAEAAVRRTRADVWGAALAEYETVQRALAGQPGAQINLGALYLDLGKLRDAEAALREAIRLDPQFVPAYVNLADVQRRASGGEKGAEGTLREGLRAVPQAAALYHALGLSLVRQERKVEALSALQRALELAPDHARYGYVVAVALHGLGRSREALRKLEALKSRYPGDRDVLLTLAALRREAGDAAGAERSLRELAAVNPGDPALSAAR